MVLAKRRVRSALTLRAKALTPQVFAQAIRHGLEGADATDDNEVLDRAEIVARRCVAQRERPTVVGVDDGSEHASSSARVGTSQTTLLDESATDLSVSDHVRFTDAMELGPFCGMLSYVPRLVNVVTVARVAPREGSRTKLPLNLKHIARTCTAAFFSPKRFAAVQIGLQRPRSRILVFETGKLVGTGCESITEARLATLLACLHMKRHAGLDLRIEDFEVVNTMGAAAMQTTIDCEGFQRTHTDCTMLDRSSFVGMTWRPPGQPITVEIYSTGRANISKARGYSCMRKAWVTLIPELLKHSSASSGRVAADDADDADATRIVRPTNASGDARPAVHRRRRAGPGGSSDDDDDEGEHNGIECVARDRRNALGADDSDADADDADLNDSGCDVSDAGDGDDAYDDLDDTINTIRDSGVDVDAMQAIAMSPARRAAPRPSSTAQGRSRTTAVRLQARGIKRASEQFAARAAGKAPRATRLLGSDEVDASLRDREASSVHTGPSDGASTKTDFASQGVAWDDWSEWTRR